MQKSLFVVGLLSILGAFLACESSDDAGSSSGGFDGGSGFEVLGAGREWPPRHR